MNYRPVRQNGVHGRTRTSDPRIHTTSASAAVPVFNRDVRGLDCPFTMGLAADRCCPSSLYTFPKASGLARDWLTAERFKRSPTLSRYTAPFPCAAPNCLQESCALSELSYVDTSPV